MVHSAPSGKEQKERLQFSRPPPSTSVVGGVSGAASRSSGASSGISAPSCVFDSSTITEKLSPTATPGEHRHVGDAPRRLHLQRRARRRALGDGDGDAQRPVGDLAAALARDLDLLRERDRALRDDKLEGRPRERVGLHLRDEDAELDHRELLGHRLLQPPPFCQKWARSVRLRKTGMQLGVSSSAATKVGSTHLNASSPCASSCACSSGAAVQRAGRRLQPPGRRRRSPPPSRTPARRRGRAA